MATAQVNGTTLHYHLGGPEGAPVVMFSNSLGTRLEMWDPQLPALADHRVLRYDSRGHGRSAAPAGPYTIELLATDAVGLLDALGIEKVHYCGLSKGGMVGQMLGARHGDRLLTLTLCSTAAHMSPPDLWDQRIQAATESGMAALADGTIERWFTPAYRADPARVAAVRQMFLDTPAAGYAACCAAIRDMDLRALIGEVQVPTLVMVGADDPATPPAKAEEIHERITGSRLIVTPAAAHLMNLEQPAAFNANLTAFMRGN